MEIKESGRRGGKSVMLHGNLMCARQFEDVIPLLEAKFRVFGVSFDGFDGSGETTYMIEATWQAGVISLP